MDTWHITIAIAYMSDPFVCMHLSRQNLDGAVPPPNVELDSSISGLGSCATVANPKSTRHAETGTILVTKIFACHKQFSRNPDGETYTLQVPA